MQPEKYTELFRRVLPIKDLSQTEAVSPSKSVSVQVCQELNINFSDFCPL